MTGASAPLEDFEMEDSVFRSGGIPSDDEEQVVFKASRGGVGKSQQAEGFRYVCDYILYTTC